MKFRTILSFSALAAFVATSLLGCGSDVPVTSAPAPTPVETKELPKEPKKGGGPASSGNMKRDPGKDPMKH
jgi:hypothetical protein